LCRKLLQVVDRVCLSSLVAHVVCVSALFLNYVRSGTSVVKFMLLFVFVIDVGCVCIADHSHTVCETLQPWADVQRSGDSFRPTRELRSWLTPELYHREYGEAVHMVQVHSKSKTSLQHWLPRYGVHEVQRGMSHHNPAHALPCSSSPGSCSSSPVCHHVDTDDAFSPCAAQTGPDDLASYTTSVLLIELMALSKRSDVRTDRHSM
jgi:hypothetical protein